MPPDFRIVSALTTLIGLFVILIGFGLCEMYLNHSGFGHWVNMALGVIIEFFGIMLTIVSVRGIFKI